MKNVIIIFAVVITTAIGLPTEDETYIESLQHQRRLEIYGSTRKLIEDLVGNLREAANQATDAIGTFTTRVQDEAEQVREKMVNDIKKLRERVSKAITDVTNKFSNSGSDVVNCVTCHREEAGSLFNETIAKAMNCVEQRLSEVTEQITGLSNLANEAVEFGNNAMGDMNKCTQENTGSFIATGTCLGKIAVQTEMKTVVFVTQSTLMIGRINLSVTTLPASLEVCVGSRVVDVGIASAKIIMEIGSCSASSVLSTFIGGSTENKEPLSDVNTPALITLW